MKTGLLNKVIKNSVALGIDISTERISLALLKKTKKKIILLKSASTAVPKGIIVDGNIKNPAALAKFLKNLLVKNRIRSPQTAVCLVANPVVIQIMDLPKNTPANTTQYIQSEVKHCPVLPGKDVAFDFCRISSSANNETARVFVVAAENNKVLETARAFTGAGINIRAIEPAAIACARTLYSKKIARKYESNILLCAFHDNLTNLCVFKNEGLDFIRSRNIDSKTLKSAENVDALAEEIDAIIQFYSIEVPDSAEKWELVLCLDKSPDSVEKISERLKARFSNVDVHIISPQNLLDSTSVTANKKQAGVSATALGLAMKLLDTTTQKIKVNLFPQQVTEVNTTAKFALTTASIAAAVLIIMFGIVGLINLRLMKTKKLTNKIQQEQPAANTQTLMAERESIAQQIEAISDEISEINQFLYPDKPDNWIEILDGIRKSTPKALRITELVSDESFTVTLRGQALAYDAVYLFADLLGKFELIDTATVAETEKSSDYSSMVSYCINVSLAANKGTQRNVD